MFNLHRENISLRDCNYILVQFTYYDDCWHRWYECAILFEIVVTDKITHARRNKLLRIKIIIIMVSYVDLHNYSRRNVNLFRD